MHSECPEEIFEHFSLKKRCFLKDFLTLSEKVPDFVKNLRQGLRNFNLRVRRKILRQKKTEKMLNFQWFCILSKKNWTLVKSIPQGSSKLHSECPEEPFEPFSLKERWFLIDFRTLSEKVPDFAKHLRQGFRNFNLRVRRKILRKKTEKMLIFQ